MRTDLLEPWKLAIKEKGFYQLHNCSLCNYPCGWFYEGDQLMYDSGCDCVTYGYQRHPCSEEDLLFYLDPENGHVRNIELFIG